MTAGMQQATIGRAGGLGRGRRGAKDPPKRLGKRSLEGTVCSVAKRAQDLHALRHKASEDYYYYHYHYHYYYDDYYYYYYFTTTTPPPSPPGCIGQTPRTIYGM